MVQSKKVKFDAEGVSVTLPVQKKPVKIKAKKLPLGALESMKPVKDGFQPKRLVLNLGLEDEDDPSKILNEFDPPIELRVRYTKADLDRAGRAGTPLSLAYWYGNQWIRFTKEKHQFELQPNANPESGGVGVAMISNWGDPPIAWGI